MHESGVGPLILEGMSFLEAGKVQEASAQASLAVAQEPSNSMAWCLSAAVKQQLGMLSESMADYHKARNLDPVNALAWHGMGNLYGCQESVGEALAHMQRAMELAPDEVEFRFGYGVALVSNCRFAEAIGVLDQCHAAEPSETRYSKALGEAYLYSAQAGWRHVAEGTKIAGELVPAGHYATKNSQITEAERLVNLAETVAGEVLSQDIGRFRNNIAAMRERVFTGSKVPLVFGGAASLMIFGGYWQGLWFAMGAIGYYFGSRTPAYVAFRRLFAGKSFQSSDRFLSFMSNSGDKTMGCVGMICGILLMTVLLPAMAAWNAAQNYLFLPED